MRKRLFSILLALCMVLCLVPTTAFAESETEETPVCTCETACTAEAMNTECPVCGAVGALPESCVKCSGPVEDAAAEPEVEDNEAQPEASPVVLSGKREIKSEAELNVALGDKSCTEITLGENIELSGGYIISHTVTLDLNGYTLTVNGNEEDIFSVYESGNLTVKDSGTGGKIDGQNKNCGFCIYGGVLTLESGTITNCTTDGDGGAVDISDGGKFEMSGGAITNCKVSDDSGAVDIGNGCTFIMNSGTISGCRADDDAGAIFIKGNASFVMNGGTIENCSAGFCGGAVKMRSTSRFTMNGGTISGCTAQQGGGVYVDGSSTFTMNDGSIASCTAVNGGNSVFVVKPSASFTMTGGTVDGSITMLYTVGNNTVYMDGLGTAAYPYQISTADQLKLFRDIVNGSNGQTQNRGAYAVLTADIDLNNEPWTPIGPDRDSAYTGTFDGQGHTVKNLSVTVNVQPGRAGLFGCVKDGTIRKLTVAGSVSCTANQGWCGGIAGYAMDETIENCASLCTVSCTGIDARVGGIVGLVDYNSRTLIIRDCYNIGKITGRSDNGSGDAGGICGFYMNGKISNCYNVGEITGSGYVSKIAVSAYNDIRPTNCYYLSDTDTDLNGTAKTAAEFADGTVLALLKAGERDNNADPWADECKYLAAAGKTLPVFNGQGDAHDHQSNDWKSNETEHWQVCTCGAVFNKAEHSGGTATCTAKAVCEVCKAEYGEKLPHDFTAEAVDAKYLKSAATCTEKAVYYKSCAVCGLSSEGTADEATFFSGNALDHDWGAWTQNSDEKTHTRICKRDTSHTETENCHGGTATCTAKAVCTVCGGEYGEMAAHSFTAEKAETQYLKSAATCTEKAVYYKSCAVCGLSSEGTADEATFFSGNALDHDWGAWTQNSDEKTHTRICKRDTSHTETENCHGGTATCTAKAVCTVCGGEYGEMAAHSFTAEKAETQYLKSAATCTEKAVYYKSCAVCGLSSEGMADEATFFSGNVLDHDWGTWTSNEDGTHTRTCTVDGCSAGTQTENCIDANKDHKCDICDYIISECADDNKDHKCDYCGKKLTEHTGGKATCAEKAVCEVCGKAYGEFDANNHSDLKHIDAKAATKDAEGNIEYWYCEGCGKYFSDKDGTKEIKKADTVTAKLKDDSKLPQTGDISNLALWIALFGGAAIGTTIVSRKKKYNR